MPSFMPMLARLLVEPRTTAEKGNLVRVRWTRD
jgi:hypothetical protein